MKIKTQDLIGPPLDWAVELAKGTHWSGNGYFVFTGRGVGSKAEHPYSTSGSEVIDIMEREKINATYDGANWDAFTTEEGSLVIGPTLRIAVCRCFCASKLGDEVDIPEELMK